METQLQLDILPQPDLTTCGPTCLQAVYRFFGDHVPLEQVVAEVPTLKTGGTLAVFLGCHALSRGYRARIYTYNLQVFDPTWFDNHPKGELQRRLALQLEHRHGNREQVAIKAFLRFLDLGGEVRFQDLTPAIIRRYLNRAIPILTGLSSTYLYRSAREVGPEGKADDIRGDPSGHFVVLSGYDRQARNVSVADPLPNPVSNLQHYPVSIDRVICSILLGILTYDGNLLVIQPRRSRRSNRAGAGRQTPPVAG
ncbi:MAG: C39 family peptidase [Deltaproteobacteria bacterium]|nr:C39 family peptidase [Deltaproteobacteria bacterium]